MYRYNSWVQHDYHFSTVIILCVSWSKQFRHVLWMRKKLVDVKRLTDFHTVCHVYARHTAFLAMT